jgi:hypothetical protein
VKICTDGFIAAGTVTTTPDSIEHSQMIVIRYDESGDVVWQEMYDNERPVFGRGVAVMEDGYMLVGHTLTSAHSSQRSDLIVIKTDRAGGIVKEHAYKLSSTTLDLGMDATVVSDGGCIIAGRTFPDFFAPGDLYIVKTDPDGSL